MVSIRCIQFFLLRKRIKLMKNELMSCSKFFVRESKELLKVLPSVKKDCLCIRDICLSVMVSV